MKRHLSIAFVLLLVMALIAACGGGGSNGSGNSGSSGSSGSSGNSGSSSGSGSGSSGGSSGNEKVTLQLAHFMGEEGARLWVEDFVKTFEAQNPNVTVEIVATSSDNYHTMLRTKIASDDAPDVMLLAYLGTSDRVYVDEGYVADLSDQPFNDRVIGIEKHRIDGKIYGLPFDMNAYGVMYNKDLFAQAGITEVPRTYGAFMDTLEKLQQAGITPLSAGFKELNIIGSFLSVDLFNSAYSKNPNYLKEFEERTRKFTEDQTMREALTRFAERFKYVQEDPFGTDRTTYANNVASGKAAMLLDGSWMIDAIKNINPDVNLGFFPFPYSENEADNLLPLGTGIGGWAVYEHSPNKEWAMKLLDTIASVEMGQSLQKNKKAVSVVKGLGESTDPTFRDIGEYQAREQVYDYTGAYTNFTAEYRTVFQQQLTTLLMDSKHDVDAVLKQMDAEFDRIHDMG